MSAFLARLRSVETETEIFYDGGRSTLPGIFLHMHLSKVLQNAL